MQAFYPGLVFIVYIYVDTAMHHKWTIHPHSWQIQYAKLYNSPW